MSTEWNAWTIFQNIALWLKKRSGKIMTLRPRNLPPHCNPVPRNTTVTLHILVSSPSASDASTRTRKANLGDSTAVEHCRDFAGAGFTGRLWLPVLVMPKRFVRGI